MRQVFTRPILHIFLIMIGLAAKPEQKQFVVVDIATQRLYLYIGHELTASYPISSAAAGEGCAQGSGKTPLGNHVVAQKFGENAPLRTIFKARKTTRVRAILNAPDGGDLVTTRILWLKGTEPGYNTGKGIDSYRRYIYIHGTPEEDKIGTKASHGCIRMKNTDVVALFHTVQVGTPVRIYYDFQHGQLHAPNPY